MRLTDLLIKKIGSPERGQKTFYDDALPGFGVRVSQGGSKSFVVMYGKKRQLRTLGRYPDLSLADARKEAKRVQGEVLQFPVNAAAKIPIFRFQKHENGFFQTAQTGQNQKHMQSMSDCCGNTFHLRSNWRRYRDRTLWVRSQHSATNPPLSNMPLWRSAQ